MPNLTIPLVTICAASEDGSQSFLKSFRRLLATPDVPARTAYWLNKMHKTISAEVEAFNVERDKLVMNLGAPVEGEPGRFNIKPENMAKFVEEITSLDHPVDLGVPAELRLKLPDNITPAEWLPLMDAVDLFEEPA